MLTTLAIVLGASTTQRAIGWALAAVVVIGVVIYLVFNLLSGQDEIGSEIELAPNRKPYFDDEVLEGRRLDVALTAALVLITLVAVALPIYWLAEPSRMAGAEEGLDRTLTGRGTGLYEESCSNCHGPGAVGGVAPVTLTDENGEFVAQVNWNAPALTTVLSRFSEDEVRDVLNYGRNGVMPAWGAPGGGPMTEQQIDELIHFLRTVQLTPEDTAESVNEGIRAGIRADLFAAGSFSVDDDPETIKAEVDEIYDRITDLDASEADQLIYGRILFDNAADVGAYNCARCHTQGWSYGATSETATEELIEDFPRLEESGTLTEYVPGGGFFGWNLTGGSTVRQFPTEQGHFDFVSSGSTAGIQYGQGGQGSGQMPGFDGRADEDLLDEDGQTREWTPILAPEQIEAVVAYERSL
jgi:mono/diheme cytochrome c family protein